MLAETSRAAFVVSKMTVAAQWKRLGSASISRAMSRPAGDLWPAQPLVSAIRSLASGWHLGTSSWMRWPPAMMRRGRVIYPPVGARAPAWRFPFIVGQHHQIGTPAIGSDEQDSRVGDNNGLPVSSRPHAVRPRQSAVFGSPPPLLSANDLLLADRDTTRTGQGACPSARIQVRTFPERMQRS